MIAGWLRKNLVNMTGWSTDRKIVAIASDDWGSIRMSSAQAYNNLLKSGIRVDLCRYCKYDCLESDEDLTKLFEVLSSVKDKNGNRAIMTAYNVVANPDFAGIKENGFREYYYEPLAETLKKYPRRGNVIFLWHDGIKNSLVCPQFHGREHLNISTWLRALQNKHPATMEAFNNGVFGISNGTFENKNYMAAFDFDSFEIKNSLKLIVKDGLNLFEKAFGFRSASFTAPCGLFSSALEPELAEGGVRVINVSKIRKEPVGGGRYRRRYHHTGQKNSSGQIYLTRNCQFEPDIPASYDRVDRCLSDINVAFRWKKPAIISSHRVNYIGSIDKANRDLSLRSLERLLKSILKKWPDAEFMDIPKIGASITADKK